MTTMQRIDLMMVLIGLTFCVGIGGLWYITRPIAKLINVEYGKCVEACYTHTLVNVRPTECICKSVKSFRVDKKK
jgi:hypothetical protein